MRLQVRGIGLALLALAPWGCAPKSTGEAVKVDTGPHAVPVTVAALEHRPVERTVEVNGTLKGWENVTIGSKRSGRVVQVVHDIGDRVQPGELLVRMETVDAELAVQQAERQLLAELAKLALQEMPGKGFDITKVPSVVEARVAVDRAERNYSRERNLVNKGAGTVQAMQDAEADLRVAQAALETATLTARSTLANAQATKVALQVSQQALADMELHAPVPSAGGRGPGASVSYAVTKRPVAEGQMLQPGAAVFELVIENPLRLWVNVPERFSAEIRRDQTADITVSAYPAKVFKGKVARINPAVDEASRTFQVEIATPNDEGLLRPGGYAKASILTQRDADAVVVPLESIVEFAGVTKLFVVEADKARAIPVQKGLEGNGWVEVLGTLPAQARVVTTGQTQLADGTPVVVRTPEEAAPAPAPTPAPAADPDVPPPPPAKAAARDAASPPSPTRTSAG
jgi:membrane fusion protein (multidrug efflux system)